MLKKIFIFILIFIVSITCVISFNNCKSSAQVAIEEQEAKKTKRKEELKAYEEAVKGIWQSKVKQHANDEKSDKQRKRQ